VGKPVEVNQGAVTRVPLSIEVPPDSPTANHLGETPDRWGWVLLSTTHPAVSQVKIWVRFSVEQQ
jgi:hypothetical protein